MRKSTLVWTALIALVAAPALAVTISVQGGSIAPGNSGEVCFNMADSGGQVSGVQMDIGWQSGCLSVDLAGGDEAACAVNPETNRTTFKTKAAAGGISMRVIMLNIADTTPIPANVSQLFCCSFRAGDGAAGRTCPVTLSNVIASDPTGKRLSVSGQPGAVAVSGSPLGSGRGGAGSGGGMAPIVPPMVGGGAAPAPAGGGTTSGGTTSGGAAPAAPQAAPAGGAAGKPVVGPGGVPVPAMPNAPVIPGMPAPGQLPTVGQAAQETVGAVIGTQGPTAKTTPAAKGTQTAKSTAKETPKPHGTPTPKKTEAEAKGTPTAKKPAGD